MDVASYFKAIKKKDFEGVKAFINLEQSVYQWSEKQEKSSFHEACRFYQPEIFDFMLNKLIKEESVKDKWNTKDGSHGRLPHHWLALTESSGHLLESFMKLKDLIEIDLEVPDKNGKTLLDLLKDQENQDVIDLFTDNGSPSKFSAFWQAIVNDDIGNVKKLFKKEYLAKSGPTGTCLQNATFCRSVKVLEFLLEQEDCDPNLASQENPFPPIFIACQNLDKNSLEALLNRKSTIITKTYNGNNLLHVLLDDDYSKNGSTWPSMVKIHDMLKLILEKRGEEVGDILNTPQGTDKETPLHLASKLKGQAIVRILLEAGAEKSLFLRNRGGESAINLIQTSTIRDFLDSKISWQGPFMHKDFEITINGKALIPPLFEENDNDIELSNLKEVIIDEDHIKPVSELEYIAGIADHHVDLFDHPVISSIIWKKYKQVKFFFFLTTLIKVLNHMFGCLFILANYGGDHLPWNNCTFNENSPFFQKKCCLHGFLVALHYLFGTFFTLNGIRFLAIICSLMRKSWESTMENWGKVFRQLDFKLTLIIMIIVPCILTWTDKEPNLRDLSGFYILLASFDLFLAQRDLLKDRRSAAMITWTEVVSASILTFMKVHVMILLGFMFAFYIQLHDDSDGNSDGENPFHWSYKTPMKTLAMFVGELEYGDFPFQDGFLWNHLTFIFFVYFIVLVMMNLLTGLALMDVQEIRNASTDKTWHETMMKIMFFEEILPSVHMMSKRFKVFNAVEDTKFCLRPFAKSKSAKCSNCFRCCTCKKEEFEVTEKSINIEARRIIEENMKLAEEKAFA